MFQAFQERTSKEQECYGNFFFDKYISERLLTLVKGWRFSRRSFWGLEVSEPGKVLFPSNIERQSYPNSRGRPWSCTAVTWSLRGPENSDNIDVGNLFLSNIFSDTFCFTKNQANCVSKRKSLNDITTHRIGEEHPVSETRLLFIYERPIRNAIFMNVGFFYELY